MTVSKQVCFVAAVYSLYVSDHWEGVGLARNVTSSVLCIPLISGSVSISALLENSESHQQELNLDMSMWLR